MSNILKRLSVLLMSIVLIAALLSINAFAAGRITTDQPVSLTISYKDGNKAISGARFSIYRVADVDEYAQMTLTKAFEAYEDTIDGLADLGSQTQKQWLSLASTLRGYVLRDQLTPAAQGVTDNAGTLIFSKTSGIMM